MDKGHREVEDALATLRCQARDTGAFEAFVQRFEAPLRYYLTKLIGDEAAALDALQEVWVRVVREIGKLREVGAVRTWLYRVARGVAVDEVRRAAARERAEEVAATERREAMDEESFDADSAEDVHTALDRLEPRLREVLVLYFLEGYSGEEIAGIVACPVGTVKSRMHHAKAALRRELQDEMTKGGTKHA